MVVNCIITACVRNQGMIDETSAVAKCQVRQAVGKGAAGQADSCFSSLANSDSPTCWLSSWTSTTSVTSGT